MQKIIFICIFIFLFIGCASTRNNTGGTLGIGSSHLESIATAGSVASGIETGNDLTSRIANQIDTITDLNQSLANSNKNLTSTLEYSYAINERLGTLLQSIRERFNQENNTAGNKNQFFD
ncbi:MAG: hypothetical protein ACRC4W_09100 [Treponemataceae bacterium]